MLNLFEMPAAWCIGEVSLGSPQNLLFVYIRSRAASGLGDTERGRGLGPEGSWISNVHLSGFEGF